MTLLKEGHRLSTSRPSRSKQSIPEPWYWYCESKKSNIWTYQTSHHQNSRCKGVWGHPHHTEAAVYPPETSDFLHTPPLDAFIALCMVLKSSRTKKVGGRTKSWRFWLGHVCTNDKPLALLEDTDLRLQHHRARNKWYQKIGIDILNRGKATNGHLGSHTTKTIGARRSSAFVCVHTGLLRTKVVLPIVLFDF